VVTERRLEGLEFDIGELIARNQRVRGRDFGRYDRDPVRCYPGRAGRQAMAAPGGDRKGRQGPLPGDGAENRRLC